MTRKDNPQQDTDPFYSQHGEDIIAWKIFQHSSGPKYFVEIGMVDGIRFSNTYALERRGWHGLCVEAHPHFVDMVRQHRPASTVVHAAAADVSNTNIDFYMDPRGDLSSLIAHDESEMKGKFGHWFKGYEKVRVPARTLNDMLKQANAPRFMEVVSIDIEGAELTALRGFDLNYWRPRLLILEADDAAQRHKLNEYLQPQGYQLARMVGINALYTRKTIDAFRIRLVRVDQKVLHTANPMDQSVTDQLFIPIAFETRSQHAMRVLRTMMLAA